MTGYKVVMADRDGTLRSPFWQHYVWKPGWNYGALGLYSFRELCADCVTFFRGVSVRRLRLYRVDTADTAVDCRLPSGLTILKSSQMRLAEPVTANLE